MSAEVQLLLPSRNVTFQRNALIAQNINRHVGFFSVQCPSDGTLNGTLCQG